MCVHMSKYMCECEDVCALKCVNMCKCVGTNVWLCMRVFCENVFEDEDV